LAFLLALMYRLIEAMRRFYCSAIILSCSVLWNVAFAAGPDPMKPADNANKNSPTAAQGDAKSKPDVDLFDFSETKPQTNSSAPQRYLKIDESIKLRIDPLARSAVVDRVFEDATIFCNAPAAYKVQIFIEPVDGPFAGKSAGHERLIGTSSDRIHAFPVNWTGAESSRYVKIWAMAYRKNSVAPFRSSSVCVSMGGVRLQELPPVK